MFAYQNEAIPVIIFGDKEAESVPVKLDGVKITATEYYEKILPGMDVEIHLNTEATKEIMNAADAVIVAVGAHDITLPIEGADAPTVVSSWDVLAGKELEGKNVVVIGRSNIVGKPVAKLLLDLNCNVTILHSRTKEEDMLFG